MRRCPAHCLPSSCRSLCARLSQLADGFVEQPAADFPEGTLVSGQVAKIEGDKCVGRRWDNMGALWRAALAALVAQQWRWERFPDGAPCLPSLPRRVDLSLRSSSKNVGASLEALEEGQVVRGTVKRVAKFGVFVDLDGTPTVTGACLRKQAIKQGPPGGAASGQPLVPAACRACRAAPLRQSPPRRRPFARHLQAWHT